jgi:putative ABC transport system permease protein
LSDDWRCKNNTSISVPAPYGVLVGDEKLLTVLGIDDDAAAAALARGWTVSFDKRNVTMSNTIEIRLVTGVEATEKGEDAPGEIKSLPVHQATGVPDTYGASMIVSPTAAEAAGITTVPIGAYFSTDGMPTAEQRQKLENELDKTGAASYLYIEEGYTSKNSIVLLALTVFAGLITIGAAGIVTGLAQADAEADLKTLAAVGAPPRVRRTLSGFQCGVVAAMGVVLGSAAGVLPAVGLRLTEKRQQTAWYKQALADGREVGDLPYVPIVVSWETLAMLLLVVPVGAALLAASVTRSRGALTGREAI